MARITAEELGRLYREHAAALRFYGRQWPTVDEDMVQEAFIKLSLQSDGVGLNADHMLFAAGLAAGRRGRRWWAGLSGALALLSVGLAFWGWSERLPRPNFADRTREGTSNRALPAAEHGLEPSPDS